MLFVCYIISAFLPRPSLILVFHTHYIATMYYDQWSLVIFATNLISVIEGCKLLHVMQTIRAVQSVLLTSRTLHQWTAAISWSLTNWTGHLLDNSVDHYIKTLIYSSSTMNKNSGQLPRWCNLSVVSVCFISSIFIASCFWTMCNFSCCTLHAKSYWNCPLLSNFAGILQTVLPSEYIVTNIYN